MKFARVAFGINCSPFLLSATIRHHLALCPPSFVTSELADNLYVDDFLSGADTESEARALFTEANRVMDKAGMRLAKWSSNDSSVIGGSVGESSPSSPYKKVLGVTWSPTKDDITFVGVDLPEPMSCSKRVLLSFIARVFDPLGFILPFTVSARFLFQDIWRLGLSWDEQLPSEMQIMFRKWLEGLRKLKEVSIPRQYFSVLWSDCMLDLELHAFGDASIRGYGACVYIRHSTPSGQAMSALVRSCARVAPLERKTLPRLELLGCLVTAQLVCSVIDALRLPKNVRCTCWTDSMVALGWILGSPSKWKPWVANRVATIHSLTSPEAWKHIAGIDNPADLVSRGISADKLADSELWWHGPLFLRETDSRYPTLPISLPENNPDVEVERKRCSSETTLICASDSHVFQVDRWSTLNKAYRVIAWVLLFVKRANKRNEAAEQTSFLEQYDEAKHAFIKILQRQHFTREIGLLEAGKQIPHDSKLLKLAPFLDEKGVLRVRGRIQLSDLAYESKHPVILPRCHGSMLLIRFVHAHQNHAGIEAMITTVRMDYEIFGLRQMAKAVKKNCISCQRFDTRACNEPPAPLPKARVTRAPAFSVTGVDFAGPVYCLDFPGKKFYICLFVCGVVRAVHLELVDSLSSNDFILAFRRFAALKRVPDVVYSDNGRNLVGGQRILESYLGPVAPKWKFICPRSPWWGGWWERLVRSVKNGIRKTIGKQCLTKTEFETCLCEVAASINSRPLTFVGTDIQNKPPLTPNHFLTGQGNQSLQSKVIEDPENVSVENLCIREQEMLERQDHFWRVWSEEYVRNLPAAFQKFKKEGNLEVGSVVLIREDGLPRLQWVVGVVEKLHMGKDGIPRSADLRTSRGCRTRAVQRLYNLEITDVEEPPRVTATTNPPTSSQTTNGEAAVRDGGRPVRNRKVPTRFDDFV